MAETLLKDNGPLICGERLWRALGFRSAAAFRQAKSRAKLGVRVFNLPSRRGTFAYTSDVADWLAALSQDAGHEVAE